MNNYTNPDLTQVDYKNLYIKAENITKNILNLKDSILKIDNYISSIEEDAWKSPASSYLKERYQKEKINYQKLCDLLSGYVSKMLEMVESSEDYNRKKEQLIDDIESIKLWDT